MARGFASPLMTAIRVSSSSEYLANMAETTLVVTLGPRSIHVSRYERKGSRLESSFSAKSSSRRTLRRKTAMRWARASAPVGEGEGVAPGVPGLQAGGARLSGVFSPWAAAAGALAIDAAWANQTVPVNVAS